MKRCFGAVMRDPRVSALFDEYAAVDRRWHADRAGEDRTANDRLMLMRSMSFAAEAATLRDSCRARGGAPA